MHQQSASSALAAAQRFDYSKAWLRFDVVAGLTTAAVVVPKSMAYATIAGLPPEVGLYTAIVPMVIYAVLSTSRVLSVSTTSTIAILTASALASLGPNASPEALLAAASTLALLVGAILVIASLLRLGFVANFISDPVLTGFKAGVGLVIIVDQVPKLLGIHIDKAGFLRDLVSIATHLSQSSVPTVVLAVGTLALILVVERFLPRAPAPLFAVIVGIAASGLLGLADSGIATIGHVRAGLPAPRLPDISLIPQLWPAALGIALMSFTESIATARTFVARGEPRPQPDRELLALGVGNAIGSLIRIMPAGGGTSQTAVNRKAGAKSQLAAAVTAAVVVVVLLFLSPVIALLPHATLAAVVVATTIGLVNPADFLTIRNVRRVEFRWAVVALVGVVLLGSLNGILVAVAVSLLALIYHSNHPLVYVLARKPGTNVFRPLSTEHADDDETFPGLLILRTEGRIHFANAQRVGDKMWPLIHRAKPKVVLLDCSAIPDIEYTALRMLTDAEEKLRQSGIALWLAALNPQALDVIRRTPLDKILGRGRMFFNVEQAVGAWRDAETMAGYATQRIDDPALAGADTQ
jgi:sulfate permease, SulP family